jgi:hypothetical protein
MARPGPTTAACEAVDQLLRSEQADMLREPVALMVAERTEAALAPQVGVRLGRACAGASHTGAQQLPVAAVEPPIGGIQPAIPRCASAHTFRDAGASRAPDGIPSAGRRHVVIHLQGCGWSSARGRARRAR